MLFIDVSYVCVCVSVGLELFEFDHISFRLLLYVQAGLNHQKFIFFLTGYLPVPTL
jgi:hypothetical protein